MKEKTIFIKLDNTNNCQHSCLFLDSDGWCKLLHIIDENSYLSGRFCDTLLRSSSCPLKNYETISLQIRLKD